MDKDKLKNNYKCIFMKLIVMKLDKHILVLMLKYLGVNKFYKKNMKILGKNGNKIKVM